MVDKQFEAAILNLERALSALARTQSRLGDALQGASGTMQRQLDAFEAILSRTAEPSDKDWSSDALPYRRAA